MSGSGRASKLGLTLRSHPLALLRPVLKKPRLCTAAGIARVGNGRRVRYAGIVMLRQQPDTAKSTAFVSPEDETGVVQAIAWKSTREAQRAEVLRARWLGAVWIRRREQHVKNLIVERLQDLTPPPGKLATTSRDFR